MNLKLTRYNISPSNNSSDWIV